MAQRLRLDVPTQIIREDDHGIFVQTMTRLVPGREVVLVTPAIGTAAESTRTAFVWSWQLMALGSKGPIYQGYCRWA